MEQPLSKPFEISPVDAQNDATLDRQISRACDRMEKIYLDDCYTKLTVSRSWSKHNPVISGEMARPSAYRWYLTRELRRLAKKGATIRIEPSRKRVDLGSPALLETIDENDWDLTQKKLFLFEPERIDLSAARIEHYTGTQVEQFQRYILLTNYQMHMQAFWDLYPGCTRPTRENVQMPAYHMCAPDNSGVSIINIGVGPSNAKNFTDHIAVLRPDAMLMVGHCGGIRNRQEIGDFVLASGYMRADRVLDENLPINVPITPNDILNGYLASVLDEAGMTYRLGTVYTTVDRNWEFALQGTLNDLRLSRAIGIDMESATVATNGFRYRIPNATFLCVSDKPLHGKPKLPDSAVEFYRDTQRKHIGLAINALKRASKDWPRGLPTSSIRAPDEPLMGGPMD